MSAPRLFALAVTSVLWSEASSSSALVPQMRLAHRLRCHQQLQRHNTVAALADANYAPKKVTTTPRLYPNEQEPRVTIGNV